jgi:glycerol-3-phosphate dehydrogenase subunit C
MHIIQGMELLDGEAKPPAEALHPIELMARAYGLTGAAA